jgi:hypothetical protein
MDIFLLSKYSTYAIRKTSPKIQKPGDSQEISLVMTKIRGLSIETSPVKTIPGQPRNPHCEQRLWIAKQSLS